MQPKTKKKKSPTGMFSARTLAALLPESWFRRTKRTCHLLAKHPRLEPCCSEGTLGWGSPQHPAPPLCPLPSAAHPQGACQRAPGCASFALTLAGDMVCVERPPLTSCLGTLQGGVLAQSHLLPEPLRAAAPGAPAATPPPAGPRASLLGSTLPSLGPQPGRDVLRPLGCRAEAGGGGSLENCPALWGWSQGFLNW